MRPEELKELNEISWWHIFQIDGVMTPGKDSSVIKLINIKMPYKLDGKTVLDVGAWDGFFSFEAERRGAKRVLAIDTITWQKDKLWDVGQNKEIPHSGKKGFNFARRMLKSKVEDKEIEVMDLSKESVGEFDVVLCLGIMYHMEDPWGMIKRMAEITKELLILETHYDVDSDKPMMAFYPNNECNNDPGTWWGPNPKCVEAMLLRAGFKEVKIVDQQPHSLRVTFHARK